MSLVKGFLTTFNLLSKKKFIIFYKSLRIVSSLFLKFNRSQLFDSNYIDNYVCGHGFVVFRLSPFLLPFLCGIFFSFILDLLISIGPLISITKSSSYPFIHLKVIFNLGQHILAKGEVTFSNFYDLHMNFIQQNIKSTDFETQFFHL